MQHKTVEQVSLGAAHLPGQKSPGWLAKTLKKRMILVIAIVVAIVIALFMLLGVFAGQPHRSESYKEISGGAGLNATIAYDCKQSCEQKFNFNVYILSEAGQQVGVVQPDNEGHVRLALPEGRYVMLIGKQLGKDKLFPQESILLKNGQELELKLQYKEVG